MDQLAAIRVFIRTVEAGSVTRAAASLSMPKSTASKFLADLEAHLETRLLLRSTRSLSLTAEGEEYFAQVSPMLLRLQDLDESLQHQGRGLRGRVRVDVHSSMANLVLIPALPDFQARYPDIQVAIGISDRPVGLIEEAVDCVIRLGKLADSTLISRKIYDDRMVTCASPTYLRGHPVPKVPDDLRKDHRMVGYFSALGGQVMPLVFAKGNDATEIDAPSFMANDSMGQVNMILNGLGIGQTYRSMVRTQLASGALIPVLEDWTRHSAPISVLYPASKRLNARTRAFIEWFERHLYSMRA